MVLTLGGDFLLYPAKMFIERKDGLLKSRLLQQGNSNRGALAGN